MQTHISETATMGIELGSEGIASIVAYAFIKVWNIFSKVEKVDKNIEEKLLIYKLKELSENQLVLTLKQLDY